MSTPEPITLTLMKRPLNAFHGCMLAILTSLFMAACSPEKSNAQERLKPAIVTGEIAGKPYAAALTPVGWVGGRRWSWMGGFSEDGVCVVQEKPEGKFGAIDESGKLILPLDYESVSYFEGSFAVMKGKSWGYLNRNGSVAITFTDEWSGAEPFSRHGLALVKKGIKWGFIDKQGRFAIPPMYEDAGPHGKTFGLATIMKNGLWGCIDTQGKEVISPVWAESIRFRAEGGGRAAVRKEKDGLWGYIDPTGKLVIPLQYEKAEEFSEGVARVTHDSRQMLIDTDGREVFSLRSIKKDVTSDDWQDGFGPRAERGEFCESIAWIRDNGLYGAVDSARRVVIPAKYDYLGNCSDGMIAASKERTRGYLRPDGSVAIPFTTDWTGAGDFKKGLAPVFKQVRRFSLGGYMNKEGVFVIPPSYQEASSFNAETGLALTKKGELWGWIDTMGIDRISRSWLSATDFRSGLAAVQSPDTHLWGYIDSSGKLSIPLQFKRAASFEEDGLAEVTTQAGEEMLINLQGKVVQDSERLINERRQRKEASSQHIGRVNGFGIISHRRGLVKFGIERQGESKTYALAQMDGRIIEPSTRTILQSSDRYTFASCDEDESNYGMPSFKIRHDDGTFTREFSVPLDEVEDIDETGAHTQTLGHNRYPLFPFPVSPEFADPEIKIPAFRRVPTKQYEKVYFIAWSGLNDLPGFVPLVMETAEWFAQKGADSHVFFPIEDQRQLGTREVQGRIGSGNKPTLHDCDIRKLRDLMSTIQERHPNGSQVAIVFLIGGHGSASGVQDGNGYSIVGPARKLADGKEFHQAITQDVLAYLGRVLAGYDVRFINGACFGANTTDTFFASYLKHRAHSGGDTLHACSSVHANWHMAGWGGHEANTYWPWKLVMSAESSFLRASFAAMWGEWLGPSGNGKAMKDGELRLFETSISNLFGWNIAMTTSEQIVYFDRLFKLGKFKTEYGLGIGRFSGITSTGSDELDEEFFSLSEGSLTAPRNKEYWGIYEESKRATETFLRQMNLSQQTLASLGVGKLGEIVFERVSEASKSPANSNLGAFDAELSTLFEEQHILYHGYKQFTDSSPELVNDLSIKLPRFGRLKYSQIVAKLRENCARQSQLQSSEHYKKQKIMIMVKRLGLMLDFLNDPNVPQKRKDLFAWCRAAELMPLMPPLFVPPNMPQNK